MAFVNRNVMILKHNNIIMLYFWNKKDRVVHRAPDPIVSLQQIKVFDQNEFLQNLWSNYNPGQGLEKADFSSVLVQIDRFIGPVYEALLREDEFWGMWSSKENVWK